MGKEENCEVIMGFFIVLFFLLLGFLGLLGFLRWKEKKFLKKSTREGIKSELRQELELEKKDALRRKENFENYLKRHGS